MRKPIKRYRLIFILSCLVLISDLVCYKWGRGDYLPPAWRVTKADFRNKCPMEHKRSSEEVATIKQAIHALPPGSPLAPAAFEWDRLRRETELCNQR